LGIPRPDLSLKRPKHKKSDVSPYSKGEVLKLIEAARFTRDANTNGRRTFRMKHPTGIRDRTIILVLLDTGMRVSELCRLSVNDLRLPKTENLSPENGYFHIKHQIILARR
jgi:integrase